ncbi:hypothetical protein PFICI_04576 [Pestalotiopsis fici W106-1]|uniref:Xaa-Pro dipeptidyl-peptidase C-terminal domain-containing protein n=1 Tax=Pestalotiopsis fici (strain W106-1 / CGMCC3.15140) TaxID=1229662 RepID=W3X9G0_PESFW|nr:uncharacterized protein PFICI_04576 [Pestalotiopsis fici W106-1]ETS82700.1 hypothetical protein PFICI_04576 [Pestalotiopsis fici W106-1]
MIAMAASISAAATAADEAEIVEGTLRIYGNDSYTIPYRKALSNDAPRARYPGFDNTTYLLKNGTIRRDGARALECDIILERDVAMTLRDGVTMYADVFRPANNASVPTILAWSPYGKEIGGQWLDDVASRSGVDLRAVSELQKFEGPDPAYWVAQGYAVVNPDSRGAYSSDGNITFWGRQLAEDGYDFIEWIAEQPWSTGKVAMSGNSWLAVSQWFIAAEQPPHLTAIAPWEGLTDLFRDSSNRGGIPQPGFQEGIITTFAGNNFVEDSPRMIINRQFMDEYWEDKVARLDQITAPAYIVASYTNTLHTHGSFQGFRNISSSQKWLRVHNSSEWPDYYATEHVQDLTRFFDYFLKGIDNGWEETAPVRLAVLDPAEHDILNRATTTWPPPGQVPNKFYLASNNSLSPTLETMEQSASYVVTGGADSIEFKWTVDELVETIGYMKVRVWVEAVGSDDMELSFTVAKRTANGTAYLSHAASSESSTLYESTGLLRVSQRHVDESKSGLYEPYLTHDREELLSPGEIVPVEVGLWPIALRLHPGEQLVLTISAASITPATVDLGFGTAIVPVPAAGGTFAQGANVTLINLGGDADSNPAYVNAQRVETPASRNNGTHVFHFGGSYDSYVLVPLGAVSSSRCSSQS